MSQVLTGLGSIFTGYRASKNPGQSGEQARENADPFAPYRGQFGQQLNQLFGQKPRLNPDGTPMVGADGQPLMDASTPDWMNPGMGLDMGGDLPDAGVGMANTAMLDPTMNVKYDPEAIRTDPAYQFQLQSGRDAIQNTAAANGTLESGATLADLSRYGQGLASDFTAKQFDRDMTRFNTGFGANLAAFQAQNQAQNQGFGQALNRFGARNAAQGQRFGQGSAYAGFLSQLAGANQNPAAGQAAFQEAQQSQRNNRRQGYADMATGGRMINDAGMQFFTMPGGK